MKHTFKILFISGVILLVILLGLYLRQQTPVAPLSPPPAENTPQAIGHDPEGKITFRYPPELTTNFLRAQDWPPQVSLIKGDFTCTQETSNDLPAVKKQESIRGREYCVAVDSEGAAGSTYRDYSYTSELFGQLLTIHFVLQYPNCANYDSPQKENCEKEYAAFSPDALAADIRESVR